MNYVQQDMREIFLPTSLPDPPGYVKPRKLNWRERFEVCCGLQWSRNFQGLSRQHIMTHSSHVQIVQGATQDYVASWTAEPEPVEQPENKSLAPIKEELGMSFLRLLSAWTDPELFQQDKRPAVMHVHCATIIMKAAHHATLWFFGLCFNDYLMILPSLVWQHGASWHTVHLC